MEILLLWFGCAVLCAVIASNKKRSAVGWLILGAIFGIFALVAIIVFPSLAAAKDEPTPETHVKCPDCRELVRMDARVCKHCQCKLIPQQL